MELEKKFKKHWPEAKKLGPILQQKYPYVGEFPTKKAEGGRIGLYAGGVPSPYSMEDARKTSMQDKMGGITDVMKRADLFRSGDVGQMYMAQGGRIGFDAGGNYEAKIKELMDKGLSRELAEVMVMSGLSSDRYDVR